MTHRKVVTVLALLGVAPAAFAQAYGEDAGATEEGWRRLEAPLLTNHVEITSRDDFVKAGEAYFDPTSRWIIFQAVPVPPPGEAPDDAYSMYVAKLVRDEGGHVTGLEEPILLSEPGSANTCGWFHPTIPGLVLFGSTIVHPADSEKPGYDSGRYRWSFPEEMEVVVRFVPEIAMDVAGDDAVPEKYADAVEMARPMFERPGYTAEASWSPDGRYVLYAHAKNDMADARRPDADIWIYDTTTDKHYPIVTEIGYDGGPFFSPDGKHICYRSDRRRDSMLQLFISDLAFDAYGAPSLAAEHELTANDHVNWAPFWHPSGTFLVYATSEMGHTNYEIFSIEADTSKPPSELAKRRVTRALGADVLPVFNADGSLLMWTAQRGPMVAGESKPSSQVMIAEVDPKATPDRWFHKIDEAEASAIAMAEVLEREGWKADELDLSPRQSTGDVWRIVVWRMPRGPGGSRVIELASDGTVLRYVTPE